jgi:FlaA1/EpsC-like NDP-sugar epimerase
MADRYGAEDFVLISTDKAVYPTSVMGTTKRAAEMLAQYFNRNSPTRFVSVRFGNVLESNGSVVPRFRAQIQKGGPVTVTHPEIKRYFITIQEAVQLVLHAAVLGEGGETFVLDMGEPIKVLDLVKTMIILSGFSPEEDIPIEIIGLRPAEKLTEELFEEGERVAQTRHEKIRVAQKEPATESLMAYIEKFEAMNHKTDPKQIKALLQELIPTYCFEETLQTTFALPDAATPADPVSSSAAGEESLSSPMGLPPYGAVPSH